jgi:hypothetical protein
MIARISVYLIAFLNVISVGIPHELFRGYLLGLLQESRFFSSLGLSRKTSRRLGQFYQLLQMSINWEKILYTFAKSLLNTGDWTLILDGSPLVQKYATHRIAKHSLVSIEEMERVPYNQIISLILTNGHIQLVLDYRIWISPKVSKLGDYRKQTDLALDLIKRCQLMKLPVKKLLFDSFFASKEIVTWLNENQYTWTTRLKGNRLVYQNGKPSKIQDLQLEDKALIQAELKGIPGTVAITRIQYQDETVYAATNRPDCSQADLESAYRLRWAIETFHRDAKQNLGLDYLWMRNYRSLKKSSGLCLPCLRHPVCTTGQ